MKNFIPFFICMLVLWQAHSQSCQQNSLKVRNTNGLVAFWDFDKKNTSTNNFTAYSNISSTSTDANLYPMTLRRYNDDLKYNESTWPYSATPIFSENDGPFGKSLKVNKGYLFTKVDRLDFFNKPLGNISGHDPFTLMAWVKFYGTNRHSIAGIWDEGADDNGNKRYNGQRQYSLFTISRFPNKVWGHVSATGAASFPQSTKGGSQYARIRAINGTEYVTERWYMVALTYDGTKATCYLDGVATPFSYTGNGRTDNEDIEPDVYGSAFKKLTNPKKFDYGVGIYDPKKFIVKFNGYNYTTNGGIYEEYAIVDIKNTNSKTISYGFKAVDGVEKPIRSIKYSFKRNGTPISNGTGTFNNIENGQSANANLSSQLNIQNGDVLEISMYSSTTIQNSSTQIGTIVKRDINQGADFSVGRILGSSIESGVEMYIDGVAMYNRVLNENELLNLTFTNSPCTNAIEYCTSNAASTKYEHIKKIQIGDINNSTSASDGGYGDFTQFSTNLEKGTSNNITITPQRSNNTDCEFFAVFIDYNKDGDFLDSGEKVWDKEFSEGTSVNGVFTVPSEALTGSTRMRVSMRYCSNHQLSDFPSCGTISYGEIEDYTVVIASSAQKSSDFKHENGLIKQGEELEISLYPNPTNKKVLNVKLQNTTDSLNYYTVYDLAGQTITKGSFKKTIDVSNLKANIYTIKIESGTRQFVKKIIIE